MPIGKQTLRIPAGGGLAEKVAANLLEPPSASQALNVWFQKDGAVHRRPGMFTMDPQTPESTEFSPRYQVVGSETEVIAIDGTGVHQFLSESNSWKDTWENITTGPDIGLEIPHSYRKITQESTKGLEMGAAALTQQHIFLCTFVGTSSEATYKFTILNRDNRDLVAQWTQTDSGVSVAPVEIHGTSSQRNGTQKVCFWFGYDLGSSCELRHCTVTQLSTSVTFQNTANSTSSSLVMDVCECNGTQLSCFAIVSGTDIIVGTMPNNSDVETKVTIAIGYASHIVTVSPFFDESGYVVAYARTANDLGWKELDASLAVTFTYSGTTPANISDVSRPKLCEQPGSSDENGSYFIILEQTDGTAPLMYGLNDGGTSSVFSEQMTAVWPVTRPFIVTNSPRRYAFYGYPGGENANLDGIADQGLDLMSTVHYDGENAAIVNFQSTGKVGVYNTHDMGRQRVYSISQSSTSIDTPGALHKADWITGTPIDNAMEFHFSELFQDDFKSATTWKTLPVYNCGRLSMFDGSITRPLDTGTVPEIIGISLGTSPTGSYTLRAVLCYKDNQGNITRSAPSNALTTTLSATTDNTVTVIAPEWAIVPRGYCELYRTENNGSILYWIGSTAAGLDTTSAAGGRFTFAFQSDNPSDSSISDNRTLYTEGGALEAGIIPQPYIVASSFDRLWMVPAEQRDEVWYSKLPEDGVFAEFSSALRIKIPHGGDIYGLAPLTDKMVVLKSDSAYIIYGTGPNNTGAGQEYSSENVNYGIGCINTNSVVSYKDGVIFESRSGLFRIGQDLSLSFLGSAVEDTLRNKTITSAMDFPARQEVRFTTDEELVLVYNYLFDRWSTWDGIEANSSTIWRGNWVYLNRDTAEEVGVAYDGATGPATVSPGSYPIADYTYTTPWIKLTSVQDFKRIQRASFLFSIPTFPESADNEADIQIVTSYNYDDAGTTYAKDTSTFAWSNISAIKPHQVQIHIEKQKVEAIKFSITAQVLDDFGTGLALDAIELHMGTKDGVFKVPAAQKG